MFDIFPLRVIKQICLMFLCLNDEDFGSYHPEIVAFVKNPEDVGLPYGVTISAYLLRGDRLRYARGMVSKHVKPEQMNPAALSTLIDEAGETMARRESPSEIAFPPLGYAMTFGSDDTDADRANISHFADFAHDQKQQMIMDLPILPVYTWHYADYRTLNQIESAAPAKKCGEP